MSSIIYCQQNDELRFNFDNQYLRNPAAISIWNQTEIGLYYQNNFTAISNAPSTMFAGVQYAIPNQNVGVGLAVYNESAGVLSNTNFNLSSAYKILDLFNNGDYLSGGINLNFTRIGINGDKIRANNPLDPLIASGLENAFSTNVGFGLFYNTLRVMDKRRPKPSFQFGFSALKTLPQNVNLESLSYSEQLYMNALIGNTLSLAEEMSLRSMLELQYENSVLINGMISSQLIIQNQVTIGLSFDKFNTVGFHLGYIIKNLFGDNSELALSANGNLPLGEIDNYINSGIAFGMQYRLNGNSFSKF
jgi:type IX secretion system PorP/SprF family membrane protein